MVLCQTKPSLVYIYKLLTVQLIAVFDSRYCSTHLLQYYRFTIDTSTGHLERLSKHLPTRFLNLIQKIWEKISRRFRKREEEILYAIRYRNLNSIHSKVSLVFSISSMIKKLVNFVSVIANMLVIPFTKFGVCSESFERLYLFQAISSHS